MHFVGLFFVFIIENARSKKTKHINASALRVGLKPTVVTTWKKTVSAVGCVAVAISSVSVGKQGIQTASPLKKTKRPTGECCLGK